MSWPCPKLARDSSTLEEPGSTRVENIQAKGRPLREGRVSGSAASFIIQYLFKEDVDGRSSGLEADAGTSFRFKTLIALCIWLPLLGLVERTAEGKLPRGWGLRMWGKEIGRVGRKSVSLKGEEK